MKSPRTIGLLALFAFSFGALAPVVVGAEAAPSFAGYWEGAVALPNAELPIRVELTRVSDNAWRGTVDIPMQGLRGYKLDPIKVKGGTIEFGLPGIPGDPRFEGKLSDDGKRISGDFSQGGSSVSFQVERKPKPSAKPDPDAGTPMRGVPGKGLAGKWRGAITPMPNVELRLALELEAAADGKLGGTLISLDQGNSRIAITALTEKDGALTFETAAVGGSFEGQLSDDGAEIVGEWTQLERSTALVFKRLPAVAAKPPAK